MFSYFTQCALLPGQILFINTHPAIKEICLVRHHDIPLTSVEMTDIFCSFKRNVTFVTCIPFAKVGQYSFSHTGLVQEK